MENNVLNFKKAYIEKNFETLYEEYLEERLYRHYEGFPVASNPLIGFEDYLSNWQYELEERSKQYLDRMKGNNLERQEERK